MTPEEKDHHLFKLIEYSKYLEDLVETDPKNCIARYYIKCKACNKYYWDKNAYNDRDIAGRNLHNIISEKVEKDSPTMKIIDYIEFAASEEFWLSTDSFPITHDLLGYCDICLTPEWIQEHYKMSERTCLGCNKELFKVEVSYNADYNIFYPECDNCKEKVELENPNDPKKYYYLCINNKKECKFSAFNVCQGFCEKCV